MPSYITQSRGRYYFTIAIPERHRAIAKERWPDEFTTATSVRKPLKTSDAKVAAIRAAPLIVKWCDRLAELEAGAAAWEQARAELAGMNFHFHVRPTPEFATTTVNDVARSAKIRFRAAKEKLLSALPSGVEVDLEAALEPERRRLDEWAGRVATLLEPQGGPPAPKPVARPVGHTFADAVGRWKADRNPAKGTIAQVQGVAKRWADHFSDRTIESIRKKDILEWRQAMQDAEEELSPQRINLIVNYAGGVLAAAEAAEWIEQNPTRGLRKLAEVGEGRDAFMPAEVSKLLNYAASMDDEGAAWVVRLGAYTGARLHEIAQLTVADIIDQDDILAIDINGKGEKTIKNKQSVRVVPIHPDIADELRVYIKGRSGRLFWKKGEASKAMGDIVTASGVRRAGVCFHSLRHSFKNVCREAGIPEEVHDALTGHAGGGVGRRYGGRPPLKVLAAAVAKLNFPRPTLE